MGAQSNPAASLLFVNEATVEEEPKVILITRNRSPDVPLVNAHAERNAPDYHANLAGHELGLWGTNCPRAAGRWTGVITHPRETKALPLHALNCEALNLFVFKPLLEVGAFAPKGWRIPCTLAIVSRFYQNGCSDQSEKTEPIFRTQTRKKRCMPLRLDTGRRIRYRLILYRHQSARSAPVHPQKRYSGCRPTCECSLANNKLESNWLRLA